MTDIPGTPNGDDLVGTDEDDRFFLQDGGDDDISGLGGNDIFKMGGSFTAADFLFGGAGSRDKVVLDGDYSTPLELGQNTLTEIEILRFQGDHIFNIIMHDANVGAQQVLNINAGPIGKGHLIFDGSNETDGQYRIFDSAGDDVVTGGMLRDRAYFGHGGVDSFDGGEGGDIIFMHDKLTADDQIFGGGFAGIDKDRVLLDGDYWGANAVVFTDTTMVGVEVIHLGVGHDYDLTSADGTVDSITNLTLLVNGGELGKHDRLRFDGSAEDDSNFILYGGAARDELIGGDFADTIVGRRGVDTMTGGFRNDTFGYKTAEQSTSTHHDFITDFHFGNSTLRGDLGINETDFVDSTAVVTSTTHTNHVINNATFDADIAAACGDSLDATLIDSGKGGPSYLVIDIDGNSVYDVGIDIVIDVTGYSGFISTFSFI